MDNGKTDRVLGIYNKLMDGELINKAEEAVNYGVMSARYSVTLMT